tara:strand:- start:197 stop:673 length:477 start_codon:yes stop_codon:yes gene_type:complete
MNTQDKESDNYSTNEEGWKNIKHLIPKDKIIWSPFYSNGTQKEIFKKMGVNILHEDKDFFEYTPTYDLLIDNPPFSKIKAICLKLKELEKPFIIICVATLLHSTWFRELFKDHLQLVFTKKRPTFTHLTNGKKNYTPPLGTIYFCYKMHLRSDLIYLE